MAILTGSFQDIVGRTSDGEVTLSAIVARPADTGGRMVTRERHRLPLKDGSFRLDTVESGPMLLELHAHGVYERWELTIPDSGAEVNTADLVEQQVDWSPEVVADARAAALDAAGKAKRAEDASAQASAALVEVKAAAGDAKRAVEEAESLQRKADAAAERANEAVARADEAARTAGKDAYTIAKEEGFQGDRQEWLKSLKGPRGDRGPQGARGEQGPVGGGVPETEWENLPLKDDRGELTGTVEVKRVGSMVLLKFVDVAPTEPIFGVVPVATLPEYARPTNNYASESLVIAGVSHPKSMTVQGLEVIAPTDWSINTGEWDPQNRVTNIISFYTEQPLPDGAYVATPEGKRAATQEQVEAAVSAAVDGKADKNHTHPWSEVVGTIAAGDGAKVVPGAVGVGEGATAAQDSVVVGKGARSDRYGVAVGEGSAANQYSTVVGRNAKTSGEYSTALGAACEAKNSAVAVGYYSKATGAYSVAIGNGVSATGSNEIKIGNDRAKVSIDGTLSVQPPTRADHAASKSYVDGKLDGVAKPEDLDGKADTKHKHTSADIVDKVVPDSGETLSGNAGKVVCLDDGGRLSTTTPTGNSHAVNKLYVDSNLKDKADKRHKHDLSDVGFPDRVKWASHLADPDSVVIRDRSAYFRVMHPTDSNHPATKKYVDDKTGQIDYKRDMTTGKIRICRRGQVVSIRCGEAGIVGEAMGVLSRTTLPNWAWPITSWTVKQANNSEGEIGIRTNGTFYLYKTTTSDIKFATTYLAKD